MITKQQFTKYIESLKAVNDFQIGVLDLLHNTAPYCDLGIMQYPDCTDELLSLLEDVMNDTDGLIGYYCYELNFGSENRDDDLKTIDDLWNLLTKGGN